MKPDIQTSVAGQHAIPSSVNAFPSKPDYLKAQQRVAEAVTMIDKISAAIEAAQEQQETVFKRHDGIIETMMEKRGSLLADIAMGHNKKEELTALDAMIEQQQADDAVSSAARANLGQTIEALRRKLAQEKETLQQQEIKVEELKAALIREYAESLGKEYLEAAEKLEAIYTQLMDTSFVERSVRYVEELKIRDFCPSYWSKLVIPHFYLDSTREFAKNIDNTLQVNSHYGREGEIAEARVQAQKAAMATALGIEI